MTLQRNSKPAAFTIVELISALGISVLVLFGLGVLLADSQRGWNSMYSRVHAGVIEDGHFATATFQRLLRKSSQSNLSLDPSGAWVEASYYHSPSDAELNRYARFYTSSKSLKVEHGTLDPRVTTSIQTICSGVTTCTFRQSGSSVQMHLSLDDGNHQQAVVATALLNNE